MRLKSYRAPTCTLRVVNPSITRYRERWVYAWGWVLLQESPR